MAGLAEGILGSCDRRVGVDEFSAGPLKAVGKVDMLGPQVLGC